MVIDLLIENAWVYNTINKKFEIKNLSVAADRFYFVSDTDLRYLNAKKVIDATNKYIVPGLLDIHMHIESSMTTPAIFEHAAMSYGVTTIVADAHEIANVFGIEGLKYFMSEPTQLDIFHAIPSSVPSTTPELETTGGLIGLDEVKELLLDPRIICLGEAMNFNGITDDPDSLIRRIIRLCQKQKPTMPLEGHCPKVTGESLAAFMYSGITSDHTHQFPESLYERLMNGMFIQFQSKSITPENMQVIIEHACYEHACFITDDVMADDLLTGHLNLNLLKAVECGLPMNQAIYMTTYTPARRMGLHDRGMIAPGKLADFIILSNLDNFEIESVFKRGQIVHKQGEAFTYPTKLANFPKKYYQSINCHKLTKNDLRLQVVTKQAQVRCNVIKKHEIGTFTEPIIKELPVISGEISWQNSDCNLLVVMERYGKNGNVGYALMDQAITNSGAIATTWAHDHHNLMILGNNDSDMILAQERLLELNGGYVVVEQGKVTAECPLPLGGILSQAPLSELGAQLQTVRSAIQRLGYKNMNEIMSFSTLSLPVSPAIKVTDFGMMDTLNQQFYPLVLVEDGELRCVR